MRSRMLCGLALAALVGGAACGAEERNFGSGGAGGGSASASATGTGGAQPTGAGPQLVRSVPASGDGQASLNPYFFLYFDRPVSFALGTGKIRVSSDKQPDPVFVQTGPCPDQDPTCIAGAYPEAFQDRDGRLFGATKHTILIDKSLPDSDGKTNDVDTSFSYTTFEYGLFVDDSAVLRQEVGGLDYDPLSKAIFVCGPSASNDGSFTIRKIAVQNDAAATPITAATTDPLPGGPYCYGLDIYDGRLFASATYAESVLIYTGLEADVATRIASLSATNLSEPNATLSQVASTAFLNNVAYFGGGGFLGGDTLSGVVQCDLASLTFDVWLDGAGVFGTDAGFSLAAGVIDGKEYLFVADHDGMKISKISMATRAVENTHSLDNLYQAQLRLDSKGRLYVGTNGGLHVFDTSGNSGFAEIASRDGIDVGRFGLREDGSFVRVFFTRFRDKGVILTTSIQYVN